MSFITVKWGQNEEKIVNPNCLSTVLLAHIKKSIPSLNESDNLDLATETGEVLDLANKPKEYAKKLLEPRASYILVKVIGEETEECSPVYVSLLEQNGTEKIKFSPLNPTLRQKNKGGKGEKQKQQQERKEERIMNESLVRNTNDSTDNIHGSMAFGDNRRTTEAEKFGKKVVTKTNKNIPNKARK